MPFIKRPGNHILIAAYSRIMGIDLLDSSTVVKSVLSNSIVIEVGEFSYVKTLFQWFYTKSLPEFLLGIFNACGPLVMLLPFFVMDIRRILWGRQELLFLLVMAFLFGFIGGSDTERIFFMSGFPVLLIWMGFAIKETFESSKRWWLYVLCALQTISFRFFWILPDTPSEDWSKPIPFFGFLGDHFQYLFLYSHHGQHILNSILFLEYVALGIATWYVLSQKKQMQRIQNPAFRGLYLSNLISETRIIFSHLLFILKKCRTFAGRLLSKMCKNLILSKLRFNVSESGFVRS